MPRQLPWLNNGRTSQAQAKQPPKFINKSEPLSDIDDDFLRSAALASSNSKGKAVEIDDPENDLPSISAGPSAPCLNSRKQNMLQDSRVPSSSPPPSRDFGEPKIEFMHKGVSKFDLRDDEWMMVEDEFLETAKLFTRHLHIAEYEKLKKQIEEKKKEQVEVKRPIVQGVIMSFEGKIKEKAKAQNLRQRKAIRDVFAPQQNDGSAEEDFDTSRSHSSKAHPLFASKPLEICDSQSSTDSEDLDAPRPKAKPTPTRNPGNSSTRANPSATSEKTPKSANSPVSFSKPVPPPSVTKPRPSISRISRATPFDMLDDYVPPTSRANPPITSLKDLSTSKISENTIRSSPSTKTEARPTVQKRVSIESNEDDDGWSSNKRESSLLSKNTTERLAKRKAEREKQREEKRRAVKLDDIPTFLF